MIKIIKTIHTIIWAIMAAACCYILYAGVTRTFDTILYVSLGLLVMETLTLVLNKWTCPLTPLAGKYTSDRNDNFDIYLPKWLAKYNVRIFGIIFATGTVLVIINWVTSF